MKWGNLILLIFCIAGGLGWAAYSQRSLMAPHAIDYPLATDFSFMTLDGERKTLSAYQGKPVLLHFWATWCAPCLIEFPSLIALAKSEDIHIIAIAVKDQKPDIFRFLARLGDKIPPRMVIGLDPDQSLSKDLFGTDKLPESFLLSPSFHILDKHIGAEENWTSPEWKSRMERARNFMPPRE